MLIAVLFWIVTSLSKVYTTTVTVPLRFKNIPFSLVFEKPLPSSISVDIEGAGFDLIGNDFLKKNKEIIVDFNSAFFRNIELNKRASFSAEHLIKEFILFSDPKYKIVKTSPDSIVFDYSKKFTVKVPVRLNADINFKKQFYQSSPAIINPDSIEIAGPENELNKITFITTQPVSFKGAEKNLFFSVNLVNPLGDKIILSTQKIWVMIPVKEFTEGKLTLNIDKIYYRNKPVTLIPEKVAVSYHASIKDFSSVDEDDFRLEIEDAEKAISNNESKLVLKLVKFPKSVQVVSMQPELVDYLIEK